MRSLRPSVSWWAASWWPFLLCALLCFLAPPPVSGQTGSSDNPKSIEASLIDSLSASAQLRQALLEQRQQRADLETAYAALKAQLSSSSASAQKTIDELQRLLLDSTQRSSDLEAEIARLIALLIESRKESEALSTAFDAYREEMRQQVSDLERSARIWKAAGISGVILAIVASIVAALR